MLVSFLISELPEGATRRLALRVEVVLHCCGYGFRTGTLGISQQFPDSFLTSLALAPLLSKDFTKLDADLYALLLKLSQLSSCAA